MQTQISYQLPKAGAVTLKVYNIRGQLVRTLVDEHEPAGHHSAIWNGMDDADQVVSSGVYFYRLETGGFVSTKKMVLLK